MSNDRNITVTWKYENSTTYQNEKTTLTPVLYASQVPFYGTIFIASAAFVLLVCCCVWMWLWLCKNNAPKQATKKRLVKSGVKLPANLIEEEIQPELELNEKEHEDNYVGKLHFAIEYSPNNSALTVNVIEAHELAAMDFGGTSDPYVKVRLLPSKKPVYCTKIIKANCNPIFNETFTFEVLPTQVANRSLLFKVFDYDTIGTDDPIGSVTIPLSSVDFSAPLIAWSELLKPNCQSGDEGSQSFGDICVSLRYVAAASLLTVVIIEAKNLPMTDDGDDTDSFVKLSLYLDGKRIKKKRTAVRKACSNPYFNETFTFEVPYQYVAKVTLDVAVLVPHFRRSKRIGFIETGLEVANAPQSLHWNDMLANQRHAIARWHRLLSPETDK